MLIYVAGPYRAPTKEGISANIERAREAMLKLMLDGWTVFCPHTMTAHCDGLLSDTAFLKNGLAMLEKCDAIYLLRNSEHSTGTMMELGLAKALKLEIITEPE